MSPSFTLVDASPIDRVIARLEDSGCHPRQHGESWTARCPAHDDKSPSLTLAVGEAGRALVRCHTGCDHHAILQALGLEQADLFPPKPERSEQRRIVGTYPYVDEHGQLLFEVVRYQPKDFRQRQPDGNGGHIWNLKGVDRVLYRLPEVLAAVTARHLVWICEGEKDADALQARLPAGEVATTNPGGAGKWLEQYTATLRGAGIVIWADRDDRGRDHAAMLHAILTEVAVTVRVVESPSFKDAAEHLGAGLDLTGLTDTTHLMVDRNREIGDRPASEAADPSPGPAAEQGLRLFATASSADLLQDDEPMQWLVRGLLCEPTYGQIAGEMKTLKSYFATFLAVAVATGTPLFDRFEIDQAAPVLMYVGEGGQRPHRRRIRRIARSMGVDLGDLADQLHRSYDVAPVDSLEYQVSLANDLERIRPGLFVLDPLYAFHGTTADARNLHEEGAHLNNAVHLAREAGTTSLIANHFNQTGAGRGLSRITQAGSGEWVDSWVLLSHREPPQVAAGIFQLAIEVGSRQWGGASWHLDLNIGHFDPDTGTHDGDITWDLHTATSHTGGTTPADHILAAVTDHPAELTREDLAKLAGGRITDARRLVDRLESQGLIAKTHVAFERADGKKQHGWRFTPGTPVPEPTSDGTQPDATQEPML